MKIICSLLFLIVSITIAAQPGTLDNTFGTGGKVIENTGAPFVNLIDAVLQTDGKTVVLAEAEFNHNIHAVLLRYNTNGTLDNSFSGDGIADNPLTAPDDPDYPLAIKLQADGKILVCGSASAAINPSAFVARYNTNGSLDNTFGSAGVVYIQDSNIYEINNLVVLPNSQIVLLCSRRNDTTYYNELTLIKLNSNGSLNGSFGNAGVASINTASYASPTYSKIEVLSNGKFIVSGTRNNSGYGYDDSVMVVRVNTNGTIDNTFATNGVRSFDPGPASYHEFADMVIQPDDKILVSGYGRNDDNSSYTHITRLTTNGVKDNTFGTGGTRYIHVAATGFASNGQVHLQADGKVLVAGFAKNTSGNYTLSVARLTTTGVLDAGFDGDGIALLQVNNYGSYGIAPLQQPDGKIVVAGYAGNGNAYAATIGRFTAATGQTDNTINAGSTAIANIGSGTSNEEGRNLLVQTDQKIINVRGRDNGFATNIALSRHLPNGSLDNSFGINGRTIIDLPGYAEKTFSALLSNGKIMTVTDFSDIATGRKVGLLRFNSSGFSDTSFGLNGKLFFNTSNLQANLVKDASVQPDGKMVILTAQFNAFYQYDDTALLVRLNADGSYDNTFNGTGKKVLPSYPYQGFRKVLVQADGKILLERTEYGMGEVHTFVTRLNVDGTIDAGFNGGNNADAPLQESTTTLQPDGKILLADKEGKIVRLNSNGSFDTSFDGDGIAEPAYNFYTYEGITDIKVQADGKILLSGAGDDTVNYNNIYQGVRINSNGSLDTSFGNGGIAGISIIPQNQNVSLAMALQADGKILLTGYSENSDDYFSDFAMIRLNGSSVGPAYTFTGNGAWSDAVNWSNNAIPPATLPSGSTILIDPVAGGECVLTGTQHVSAGSTFTVKAGKKFRIVGELILQ